jgi:hypothetical protein
MKKLIFIFLLFVGIGANSQITSILGDDNKYSGTILLGDNFNSHTINTSTNWTVTNPDPTKEEIVSDGYSLYFKTTGLATSTFNANKITSKSTFTSGVLKFSVSCPYGSAPTIWMGWYVSTINCAYIVYNSTNRQWDFVIKVANVAVYTLTSAGGENNSFKIVYAANNDISLYIWNGSSWIQRGVTTNADIGTNKYVWATNRNSLGDRSLLSIDDLYVTNTNYTTYNPIFEPLPTKWVDVRQAGAKGDSINNDAISINAALLTCDTLILRNGKFKINSPIRIPSNKKLVLHNATIISAANTFENAIFNYDTTGNSNISVIGIGNASIDHNCKNNNDGSSKTTWGKKTYNSYKYISVYFLNCSNVNIRNIHLLNMNAYGFCFQHTQHSSIEYCSIQANTLIGNQVAVGIGFGSDYITVDSLQGRSYDDFIALEDATTADFQTPSYRNFLPADSGTSNITLTNINPWYTGNSLRIIACDAHVIKDVTIDGYHIISANVWPFLIGQDAYCQITLPLNAHVRNITVNDFTVVSIGSSPNEAIYLGSSCSYITFTNFVNGTAKNDYAALRTPTNIWLNGVQIY